VTIRLCPRCQRSNPDEALYCHFDGAELRPADGKADARRLGQLPHAFVFPSGRRCHSFEELAKGCQEEWEAARDLLAQGAFHQFLSSSGRMDLARAAQTAQRQADPDVALDSFLSNLPVKQEQGPQLDLNPRRLNLGMLHVGETRQVRLTILNQGQGLLHGTLAVAEGNTWLRLANGKMNGECPIKARHEQQITLRVETRGLTAPQKCSAKLTVITNGGIVEVPVRLELAAYPFALAPFQGVASPRDMAEKMRSQPKPAVPLLENNEVARWFASNGWSYPVTGQTAKGVAAVQQFFEGMGLSRPPPVQLGEREVHLTSEPRDTVPGQVTLSTAAKKWVYGRVESETPWLRIMSSNVSGPQQAVVAFEADAHGLPPGQVHEGRIRIVANAGQTLIARVFLEVKRPPVPMTRRLAQPVLVGAAAGLGLRLLLALPMDLYARVWAATPDGGIVPGSFASWLQSPLGSDGFVRHFVLATAWLGAIIGGIALRRRGAGTADVVCGILTGAVGGLAISATLACCLPALDWLPRTVWRTLAQNTGLAAGTGLVWLWTFLWIAVAANAWAVLGGMLGFVLGHAGDAGGRFLARVADSLSWTCRAFGLRRAAAFFAAQ
jgi:hypothetical protein